jgi:phosphoribosyl-ATP pyrophosphohydrolase
MNKYKKAKKDGKFNPMNVLIQDLIASTEDEVIKVFTEEKEQEWDGLPVKHSEGNAAKKERVTDIVFNHFHHPTDFDYAKWIKGVKATRPEDPLQMISMGSKLESFLMEMEAFQQIEKTRITRNPILKSDNLKDILSFFLYDLNIIFNFMCTNVPTGETALIANICEFDIIYFCIMLDAKSNNINSIFNDLLYQNGVVMLQYDWDSRSIITKERKQSQQEDNNSNGVDDNMQREEYERLIQKIPKIVCEIKNMFYFACPCLSEEKLRPEDVICCINSEL